MKSCTPVSGRWLTTGLRLLAVRGAEWLARISGSAPTTGGSMAKYLVIGANSFSGQDLIDLLLDDPASEVIGLSRSAESPTWRLRFKSRADLSRYRFIRLDLNHDMEALLSLLAAERPPYIVNFAAQSEVAQSWEYPEHWFQTNTVALARLVNFMRRQPWLERYLHISSPEAYGNCVGTVTE